MDTIKRHRAAVLVMLYIIAVYLYRQVSNVIELPPLLNTFFILRETSADFCTWDLLALSSRLSEGLAAVFNKMGQKYLVGLGHFCSALCCKYFAQ